MSEYHVIWEIDTTANSPLDAAQQAFEHAQRHDTTATVFDVIDEHGEKTRIDLQDAFDAGEKVRPDQNRGDLLATLKICLQTLEDEYPEEVYDDYPAIKMAKEAIAKAEGNQKTDNPARKNASLKQLISAIEASGGVIKCEGGLYAPVADTDWIDLGEAYIAACAELGRQPKITEE